MGKKVTKRRLTDAQKLAIVREALAAPSINAVLKKHGVQWGSYAAWKKALHKPQSHTDGIANGFAEPQEAPKPSSGPSAADVEAWIRGIVAEAIKPVIREELPAALAAMMSQSR